ncbi:unnamed protein product [Arctogadus glacialis]
MVARSRSVLQEQTVEVMEAVDWRCSSGGPWRSSGGARREVRGGRLEVLAVRSMAVVWRRSLQMEGRPGAVQPKGCRTCANGTCHSPFRRTEAEVLEAEASLEAAEAWRSWRRPTWKGRYGGPGGGSSSSQKGLEAANLEGLEAAANLEGLEAAAAAILEADYLEADCGDHPGGPGCGGSSSSKAKLFSSSS